MSSNFEWLRTFVLVMVGLGLVAVLLRRRSADLRNLAYRYLLVGAWIIPVIGSFTALGPGLPVATVSADAVRALPAWTPSSMMPKQAWALRNKPYSQLHADTQRETRAIGIFAAVQIVGMLLYMTPAMLGWRRLQRIAKTAVALPSYAGIAVWRATDEGLGVPVVYGAPARILLPADAVDWPADRAEAALLHEAAHVKRKDILWLSMARTLTAMNWWNPALHQLYRAMRASAEQAADDVVIEAGFRPSEYARELMAVAAKTSGLNGAALAMVEGEGVAHRVRAILAPGRDRRRTSAALGTVTALLVGGVTLATGSLTTRFRTLTISMPPGTVEGSLLNGRTLPNGDDVEIAAVQEIVGGRTRVWYPQGYGSDVRPPSKIAMRVFEGHPRLFVHATVKAATPGDRSFKLVSTSRPAWRLDPQEIRPSVWNLQLWTEESGGALSADFAIGIASGPRKVERFAVDPRWTWSDPLVDGKGNEQREAQVDLPTRLRDLDCTYWFVLADGRRAVIDHVSWTGFADNPAASLTGWSPQGMRPKAVVVAYRPYVWTAFRGVHLEANGDVPWRTVGR